jgi:hypothetical protein
MHTPKIIQAKQVNNENVSYCIQCCDDPMEVTWHTIHILAPDHQAVLEDRKKEIATRHEAITAWRKENGI